VKFYRRGSALTSIIAKRRAVHNQLAQQQQRNESLEKDIVQLEALASLGSATAMIAHEINNLLTPLTNYAELSLKHLDDKELSERTLRRTAKNCRHACKVMDSILSMAKAGCGEKVVTPLLPIVNGVFDCLCRDFSKDGITVETLVSADLQIYASPVQMQQAIMNLVLNAREAMIPRGGKLTISAHTGNSDVTIKISDTGCGIEKSELSRVFDRFFSTKHKQAGGSGTGLGLALCKKVIDAHGGTITIDSQTGKGTTFTITLPKK
jgi:two-component system, NtrC family, sensor kinase